MSIVLVCLLIQLCLKFERVENSMTWTCYNCEHVNRNMESGVCRMCTLPTRDAKMVEKEVGSKRSREPPSIQFDDDEVVVLPDTPSPVVPLHILQRFPAKRLPAPQPSAATQLGAPHRSPAKRNPNEPLFKSIPPMGELEKQKGYRESRWKERQLAKHKTHWPETVRRGEKEPLKFLESATPREKPIGFRIYLKEQGFGQPIAEVLERWRNLEPEERAAWEKKAQE